LSGSKPRCVQFASINVSPAGGAAASAGSKRSRGEEGRDGRRGADDGKKGWQGGGERRGGAREETVISPGRTG